MRLSIHWDTMAHDVTEDKDGVKSGFIYACGEDFPFTAKCGEWARVEWLDDSDHSYKKNEHRVAANYATRHFVTNVRAFRKSISR